MSANQVLDATNIVSSLSNSNPTILPEKTKSGFKGKELIEKMSALDHLEMYRKFFFDRAGRRPPYQLAREKVNFAEFNNGPDTLLKTVWLGHSSMLMRINGCTILTDPIFTKRISPVGPTMFHNSLVLEPEEITSLSAVIISHDHYDHLNKYSIIKLAPKTKRFLVPLGVGKRLQNWGVPAAKITELGWWKEYKIDNQVTIAATPAQHFSGRGLFDRNQTLWASWVIIGPEHRLFFSGDSGYFDGFKQIGDKYGPFDITFMECGAYNEGWSRIHMFPEQSVQAHNDLRGKVLQPIHWATFDLSLHPWQEPVERLVSKSWKEGTKLSLPRIGQVVAYENEPLPRDFWWLENGSPDRARELSDRTAFYNEIRQGQEH